MGGKVFHSDLKQKEGEKVLSDFKANKFRILIAVDALNEGFNVPDIDAGICVSGISSKITGIQQMGRVLRKDGDKKAVFINLYTQDSVEERWLRNKTSDLNPIWLDQPTINWN
jgi:superfamily II DNA or RNA helicase